MEIHFTSCRGSGASRFGSPEEAKVPIQIAAESGKDDWIQEAAGSNGTNQPLTVARGS